MKKTTVDILLIFLEQLRADKNAQAICLQQYISSYGPIPDEYGDKVRELLGEEVK